MPSSFYPKIWKLIDYVSKDCEKMAHTAQFLLCLVQEENDKVFCTKYSGHVKLKKLFQLLIATMSNLRNYICQQTYFKSCSAQIPYFPFM